MRAPTRRDPDSDEVVGRIIEAMCVRGIKQYELADAIGVGAPQISNWKCGKTYPARDTLEKIAEALETPIESLDPHHAIPPRRRRGAPAPSEADQLRRRILEQLDSVLTENDVDKLADRKPCEIAQAFRQWVDEFGYLGSPSA